MPALLKLLRCFLANRCGAVALNTGLALIPLMIALSFALDRAQA